MAGKCVVVMIVRCKLRDLISGKNMTQKDVAEGTGLSPTTISKLARDHVDRIDTKTIATLMEYFALSDLRDLLDVQDS
jgi:DNA-binding Xre family transcriptional regulator